MLAQRLRTTFADIETFLTVMQFTRRKMKVTDAATCRIGLARDLAIMLKQLTERLNHLIKIKRLATIVSLLRRQ